MIGAGIHHGDLLIVDRSHDLFFTKDTAKSKRLMQTIDFINQKSDNPLIYAAEGLNQEWKTKFNSRSHRYTTRCDELPDVV